MRLIDADKIIDWLWGEPKYYDVRNDRTNTIDYIKNQPTADVQPVVHAKWDYWSSSRDSGWECSNCEKDSPCKGIYCPNCGARMGGDTNEIT